jgi:DNA polymerase-3 subunit delta
MIIFLYGQDTFRSHQKLEEIIDHYKKTHKSGLNLGYFEGENLNFQDFKSEVETVSMFREKKLVVLKDIFTNKDFQGEFLKQGKKIVNSENVILIHENKEIDKRNSFFKFLEKNSKSQEFRLLEGQKLKNWVKKELGKYQGAAEPEALDELVNFIGSNLWQMENEIKKLANYKNGPASAKAVSFAEVASATEAESAGKKKIEVKDVELLVRPKVETDIFKTIDAISERKKSRALMLLHQHLEKGDSPLYLLAMINFQFRNLLMIKDLIEKNTPYYKIINKSKLHPFIVKKSYQQAQRFTLQQLKKIYQKIFQVDYQIKTGKIEPEVALDMLITEI